MAEPLSLGTQLRLVTAGLDGDVQALYDELRLPFRPRFFPVVQELLRSGATPVSALARAIGVSQPAASQTIGEMTRAGLVELSKGQDAREHRVALSNEGTRLVQKLEPLWKAVAEAAHELDSELPRPLSETLAATLEAFARKPFADRIREKMKNA